MTAPLFSNLFIAAVVLTTLAKLWLARRHLAHIAAHRAEVPAAFREKIELAAHQKAADYTSAKTRHGMLAALLDTLLLFAFTLGGGIQLLSDLWLHSFSGAIVQGIALIASVLLLSSLLETPLELYKTFVIEARFGFNTMTLKLYLMDGLKSLLLGALFGLPLLFGVLWLMERMGENWWLYVWAVWIGFMLLLQFIYPAFIAPLFNKFAPLQDEALKTRIENLLKKCGFTASGLFVMDGSRRSTHGNAYFTGFGKTKRIVFFDTLLARLAPSEIEAVLAHELGHFKHRHVFKRIAFSFVLSLGFLWLLSRLMHADWFYAGLGVTTHSTAVALLLFFMVLPVASFLLHPLMSFYSRKHEFEADSYAAQQTAAADLVSALVKMYQDNAATLTPDPLYSAFYDSHPPALVRISHLQTA
ncbi:MAG: M48 family metalloprotease [Sideroxydans sp.]|nr:M48 family metalloprotease [Sideroxydans sp.]